MTSRSIRLWCWVHKWTSLVCTLFLLMLCITGLPLIFLHELEHAFGLSVEAPDPVPDAGRADLDSVAAAARAARPDDVVQYIYQPPDEATLWQVGMGPTLDADPAETRTVVVSAVDGSVLGSPVEGEGFLHFVHVLHVELLAGLPGKLLLGGMALLFVVSIVSGIVVYRPFMEKLPFGAVRRTRARRTRWHDLHNVIGIVAASWMIVVGLTGTINALADIVIDVWRQDQLADMIRPYADQPPLAALGSLDAAVANAQAVEPTMKPSFVSFPGTLFSSPHHYAVFMTGNTPLTARLLKPVLIDAESGVVTDSRALPWYVQTLLISQPLHFGDYGGMPLKIIWALLDIATIAVLITGLYLWLARGPRSTESQPRSAEGDGLGPQRVAAQGARVFRIPAFLAAATAIGLAMALVGDGWWDAASWIAFAIVAAVPFVSGNTTRRRGISEEAR